MDDAGTHTLAMPEHRLERLVFFSDAVFAIAITLLIIEIRVPHVTGGDRAFLNALLGMLPQFVGFFVSFAVVGSFWAGHHRAFACAARWDPRIVQANLLLLGLIASGPFFTAFSSEYSGDRVPVALYAVWLLVTALAHLRLQTLVTHPPIGGADVSEAYLQTNRRRAIAVGVGAFIALVTALFVPMAALPSLFSIVVLRRVFDRFA